MPPTTVHVAIAALIGAALLGKHFGLKSIVIVVLAAAVIDLDTIVDIWYPGLHRALFHNLVFPAIALAVLAWDVHLREESFVLNRWGEWGVRVWWVATLGVIVHILHDAFYNGANLFWPLHDQFYDLDGDLWLSNQEGIDQSFVDLGEDGDTERGTTEDVQYGTGVSPTDDPGIEEDIERRFPLAETGEHLFLTVVGYTVVAIKLWQVRRDRDDG